jgi:TolB-like protein/DNA-binding winged helix-turn-helix (wHTH) protein/Tfp pilus assembly protein PilF
MLLERPGEVVTRDELRSRLWQQETFVDFDHSLNVAINKLREVLCDSAERSRFIETVPRLGYRFIAPLTGGTASPSPSTRAPDSSSPPIQPAQKPESSARIQGEARPGSKPSWRVRWYTVALALLIVCSAAIYYGRHAWKRVPAAPAEKVMLAVMPFENLTGDPANEYFSDGLTEEMITQLAVLGPRRLGVIARTSVMSYKHSDKTVDRVGRQLGVQYIVEGSVRQSSGRVRITAQLIQVKDQTHIWAQEYNRNASDVLTMEREVASDIAREIQLELTSAQQANLPRVRSVDPEAHELYLKGRFYWNQRTSHAYKKAIEYFDGAIKKDANYAEAYAGLADAYRFLSGAVPEDVVPKARAAAEKALTIDPNLAEAHASLGMIDCIDWDWEGAKGHFERAIALNPNYAIAHDWYAECYLTPLGRLDDSLNEMHLAQKLDPLSPVILADIGKTLVFARRYDEAIAHLRGVLELYPTFSSAIDWLWQAYAAKAMFPEALEMEKALGEENNSLAGLAYIQGRMGHKEQAQRLQAQLLQRAKTRHVDPGMIAAPYIALGDKDQAIAWLNKAYDEHSSYLGSIKVYSVYDPIRNDPRFLELERRIRLEP